MRFTVRFMLWAVVIFLLTILTARIQFPQVDHEETIQPTQIASLLELPMQKKVPVQSLGGQTPRVRPQGSDPVRIHLSKRLRLQGTGELQEPVAWIEDRATRQVGRYVRGDKILDAHLALIGSGMVWLEREGILTQLRLEGSPRSEPPGPANGSSTALTSGIAQYPPQNSIEPQTVGQQILLPGLPVALRSTQTGLLVESTEGSALMRRLGLQEGDLILAINGQKLRTPQQTAQVIRKAIHQNELDLSIQRSDRLQDIKFRRDLF